MATQVPHGAQPARTGSVSKTALEKSRAEAKAALARVKAEEKARKKAEEALTACQEDVKVLQSELDRERQLRSQVEQELAEAQQAGPVEATPAEPPSVQLEDEPSQPAAVTMPPPVSEETVELTAPMRPVQLTILMIQVFHSLSEKRAHHQGKPERMVMRFSPNENLIVQTSFRVQGPGAAQITTEEYPYVIEMYNCQVLGRAATLLASQRANFIKDTLDYSVPLQVDRLLPGLYRLLVVVKSSRMLDARKGPVILVE